MFISVFSRIAIIFVVLLVGTIARWRKLLNRETTDGLCRVALELTLPFLYFYTLSTNLTKQLFWSLLFLPLVAVVLTFVSFFFSRLASSQLKLDSPQRRTLMFLITFPNYGFLAIPLIFALFGQEGLVRVFMFNLGISFLYWTFGVAILRGAEAKELKTFKNLINNATIALILGLIVGICALRIPKFILEATNLIGSASIPLALIVVGSILAHRDSKTSVSLRTIAALIFCRLILMPALAILCINFFFDNMSILLRAIIVLQAAMPSASTTPILTRRFGGDSQLAAQGVFFTTLFSIITVPLFISLALR